MFKKKLVVRAKTIVLFALLTGSSAAVMAQTSTSACNIPATPAATPEQTAWQIFVAANCAMGDKLAWETWTEQTCWLDPTAPGCTSGTAQRLTRARSLLATRGVKAHTAAANPSDPLAGACNSMTTASPNSPLNPFVPKNLGSNPQFCEEVFVNSAEAQFINGNGLTSMTAINNYINKTGGKLNFPSAAVEVKVDWLPASSLKSGTFDCAANKPKGVFVKVIDGKCLAMAGFHISSKLYPNWVWATFEPQSPITNPNRCNPKLYSTCNDAWGSQPASSSGASTKATKQLTALLKSAGTQLAPEFQNYRLTGAQMNYNQPVASKGKLGNSFTEFNAGVSPQQSSCITCHAYAMYNATTLAPGGGFPPAGAKSIGTPTPQPGWVSVDFSWMTAFMPTK